MKEKSTKQVLLTGLKRTSEKAAVFVKEQNAIPIVFPLQETIQLNPTTSAFYDWAVFTSPAAVHHFFKKTKDIKLKFTACVGPATQEALRKYQLNCDILPEQFNSESLVEKLKEVSPESTFIYPCSKLADDIIEAGLRSLGHKVDRAEFYMPQPAPKLELPEFTDVIFFSGSAVKVMYDYYGKDTLKNKAVAAIGSKTSQIITTLFCIDKVRTADVSTAEGVVRALLNP
jgi:uroporphyrinogen-III synthase